MDLPHGSSGPFYLGPKAVGIKAGPDRSIRTRWELVRG